MIKRKFVIKCLNKEICVNLLNKIVDEISIRWMKTEIKGNSLIIEALGLPYELKELHYEVNKLRNELEFNMKTYKEFKLHDLVSVSKVTVPVDTLIEALKLLGYKAEKTERGISTSAPLDKIIEIMKKMNEVNSSDIVRFRMPQSAKKLIMIIHALYDFSPEEIAEAMRENGIIEEGDFKYIMKEEWRKALAKLVKSLGVRFRGVQEA